MTKDTVYINDRFFIHHNMGFGYIGHTEPPTQPVLNIKPGQEVIHDDIGSYGFMSNQFRFEFDNIPLLKEINLKAMWYLDLVCYEPHSHNKEVKENHENSFLRNTRLSHGIGISYALSPMISIALYYNIGNLNVKHGDDPLVGGLSLTFTLL